MTYSNIPPGMSHWLRPVTAALSAMVLTVLVAGCSKDSSDNAPTTTPPATIISKPANAPSDPPAPTTPATGSSSAAGK